MVRQERVIFLLDIVQSHFTLSGRVQGPPHPHRGDVEGPAAPPHLPAQTLKLKRVVWRDEIPLRNFFLAGRSHIRRRDRPGSGEDCGSSDIVASPVCCRLSMAPGEAPTHDWSDCGRQVAARGWRRYGGRGMAGSEACGFAWQYSIS